MMTRLGFHASPEQLATWAETPEISSVCDSADAVPVLASLGTVHEPSIQRMTPGFTGGSKWTRCVHAEHLPIQAALWDSFMWRRCLVPLSSVLLDRQNVDGKKEKVRLSSAAVPLFGVAAIWNRVLGSDQRELKIFQIITVLPTPLLHPLFSAMPVIISDQDRKRWLCAPKTNLPIELLRPLQAAEMKQWLILPSDVHHHFLD